MNCTKIPLPDGGYAIVCTSGRKKQPKECATCGQRKAHHLCDYPLSGRKAGKTCDRPMCETHRTNVGPDRDYCPVHVKLAHDQGSLDV